MTKKYTIYDNNTNTMIFESNDMFEINDFIEYNLESGELIHLHKDDNMIIMYLTTYTIYMKL